MTGGAAGHAPTPAPLLTPLLKGYRGYPGESALAKGLLSTEEYEALGRPAQVYLLYALGSWVFEGTVRSQATYLAAAQCARQVAEAFDAAGGGKHPGATCGSGYWDTLPDLVLPDGCPHLIRPGWLDDWRPGWEGPSGEGSSGAGPIYEL